MPVTLTGRLDRSASKGPWARVTEASGSRGSEPGLRDGLSTTLVLGDAELPEPEQDARSDGPEQGQEEPHPAGGDQATGHPPRVGHGDRPPGSPAGTCQTRRPWTASAPPSAPSPRRPPHRAVALASALALSGCGLNDVGAPVVTVTVTPTGRPSPTPTPATPSSIPTVAATPTTARSTPVPTALAAGPQRGAPHTWAEANASITKGKPAPGVTGVFVSPSGNIFCTIASGATPACEVADGRTPPPRAGICPAGGPTDIGRIELTSAGAVPVCNADSIRTGTPPTLAYGSRAGTPGGTVSCLSEKVGMTCADSATKHGFFVAKNTFTTF